MTPAYLYELADIADPDKLWQLPGMQVLDLPPEKRRQLDTGVALRRHAAHLQRLMNIIGTGQSLVITPLSPNGSVIGTIPTPGKHRRVMDLKPEENGS